MTITRLKLPLDESEYSALVKLAIDELRSPVDQVRFILRQEFERRGFVETESIARLNIEQKKRGENAEN